MSNSKNWKALAIPSLDGSKTELDVSGQVTTGIVPPRLTKRETKEKRPANVVALTLSGVAGGQFGSVSYKEDITNHKEYDIVLVYTDDGGIEAAIYIEKVLS